MKNVFIIFIAILFALSCERYDINLPCESNVICLSLSTDTVKADGNTIVIVTATVPDEIDDVRNKIIFSTATGTFVGETNAQTPEVKAIDSEAKVSLKPGTQPGTYRVEAKISDGATTYTAWEYLVVEPVTGKIFEFDFGNTDLSKLYADGETVLKLTTRIKQIEPNGKKMKLHLDGDWYFVNNAAKDLEFTLNTDASGECFIRLGRKKGACYLSASFEGFTRQEPYTLISSLPDKMTLIADTPQSIDAQNGSLNIKAYLFRQSGLVSLQTPVVYESTYTAANGSTVESGTFAPPLSKSDSSETTFVTFHTPPVPVKPVDSLIKIKAWVFERPEVCDSIFIRVK